MDEAERAAERTYQINLEAYKVARETRNFEITLFWQRSNYFLVLNTAVAAGFFSLHDKSWKYAFSLALFGLFAAVLWIKVNFGSKFWQNRWEHRLMLTENQLRPDMNLFSAAASTVKDDVRNSFAFWNKDDEDKEEVGSSVYQKMILRYQERVLRKPSVSRMMICLSILFALFWLAILIFSIFDFFNCG